MWAQILLILFMTPTHLSMTPLGARGSSQFSCTEREVKVTGWGGGWWAGGAARVWSSLSGPWLQHWQMFNTETVVDISISKSEFIFKKTTMHTIYITWWSYSGKTSTSHCAKYYFFWQKTLRVSLKNVLLYILVAFNKCKRAKLLQFNGHLHHAGVHLYSLTTVFIK